MVWYEQSYMSMMNRYLNQKCNVNVNQAHSVKPFFFFRFGLADVFRPLRPVGVLCIVDEERRECGAELGEGEKRYRLLV